MFFPLQLISRPQVDPLVIIFFNGSSKRIIYIQMPHKLGIIGKADVPIIYTRWGILVVFHDFIPTACPCLLDNLFTYITSFHDNPLRI